MKSITSNFRKVSYTITAVATFSFSTLMASGGHPLYKDITKIDKQLPKSNALIVAYYGRPGVSALGVLGQYSVGALKPIITKKASEYAKITGKHVVPGFDIIYGLAAAEPGAHKDYIIHLGSKKLQPYIKAAENEGFVLFVDTQLGKNTPQQAVKHILKYLKYHNVHIAIDPEFEVSNLDVRPGKKIGRIQGEWINEVQAIMSKYMKEHGITEKKMLVVHMFRHSMLMSKTSIRKYDNIKLIMNLDGHGSPKLKINIYNQMYTEGYKKRVAGGFKLFFKEDHPMMTPMQVIGLRAVQKAKVKYPPQFINYQ